MKKWIWVLIIPIIVVLCIPFIQMTEYPILQSENTNIQIDIVNISDYRIINTGSFDMIHVEKTIDASEHAEFLSSFRKLRCKKSLGPTQECLEGNAIRFLFSDGSFQLIGAETGFYCTASNDQSFITYYYDYNMFNEYIHKTLA